MSRAKVEDINDGHYVEMLDRLNTVNIMIDQLLFDHPVPINYPEVQKLVKEAQSKLVNAYLLVGSIDAKRNESVLTKIRNSVTGYQKKLLDKSEKKS